MVKQAKFSLWPTPDSLSLQLVYSQVSRELDLTGNHNVKKPSPDIITKEIGQYQLSRRQRKMAMDKILQILAFRLLIPWLVNN